ncbi:protein-L-isoaspartate O-methyltransferase family protein [Sediminispirochaeta bajacaliforniensis]|uniref:protein-L-isoaspartate O-methyltransferase family protein n=1 Tax=Sediminispirochaeta bajacaliforniensis TaxID=148 RepID=UPI000365A8EE|nr:hypothetical protein [Sediminispirochaeta bajacaliforniensis]
MSELRRTSFPVFFVFALLVASLFVTSGLRAQQQEETHSLVESVRENHFISEAMARAVAAVPRGRFFPETLAAFIDEDRPLPDSDAGITPAPSFVAVILDHLEIGKGTRLLIIGRGGGYTAAVAATLGADVLLIEESKGAARYRAILNELELPVTVIEGSWNDEAVQNRLNREKGKFDALFVHAGVDHIPEQMSSLLAPKGAAAFPLNDNDGMQNCIIYKKEETDFSIEHVPQTIFETLENPWALL